MHFSIPETEVRSGENGATYVVSRLHCFVLLTRPYFLMSNVRSVLKSLFDVSADVKSHAQVSNSVIKRGCYIA